MEKKNLYFEVFEKDGRNYSADNIVLKGQCIPQNLEKLKLLLDFKFEDIKYQDLNRNRKTKAVSIDNKPFHYKYTYSYYFGDSTLNVFFQLNVTDETEIKIEFNPNKILRNKSDDALQLIAGINYFLRKDLIIDNSDLAIDINEKKENIHFLNCIRLKHITGNKKNATENYGVRKRKTLDGCTRIYDKAEEAGIKDILTRVEITLSIKDLYHKGMLSAKDIATHAMKKFPKIYINHPKVVDEETYKNNKAFKKYKNVIIGASESCDPLNFIRTSHTEVSNHYKKVIRETFFDIEYFEADSEAIEELYSRYLSLLNKYFKMSIDDSIPDFRERYRQFKMREEIFGTENDNNMVFER